jgi:hypothetical protein
MHLMPDSAIAARLAEVAAWCRTHENELSDAILSVPGPFAKVPFPVYGAVCQQALAYAVSLGAARLIPELGATTMEDNASMTEALRQVQLLADWLVPAETAGTQAKTEAKSDSQPKQLLTGWHAIAAALKLRYNQRKDIKSLNERFEGPIRHRGAGTRPMVYLDDLLDWWNHLAIQEQELANQRDGARLSAEAQHNYGRDGEAAPEIGGGVKKRRKDKRT